MQLNSSDGTSVELRISGYESPGYEGTTPRDWDANWLNVRGKVAQKDGKTWAFMFPCLTAWEARELGDWLRGVAAGTEPPYRGICEPGGWIVFTEPNLGFTLEERTAGRVRITVDFTGEVTPPWFRGGRGPAPTWGGREPAPNSYLVCLDVSAEEVTQAVESWMHDLAEFPER